MANGHDVDHWGWTPATTAALGYPGVGDRAADSAAMATRSRVLMVD